uniref:Uncharacterized protein n=1 Tax=Globodera rostochiensis TaxID=31243 RepID=A0A914GQE7_GLORO
MTNQFTFRDSSSASRVLGFKKIVDLNETMELFHLLVPFFPLVASSIVRFQSFQDLNRHEFGLDDEGSRHCLVLRFTANLINLNLKKQLAVENVDFTSARVKLVGFCSARNELKKHSQIQASWRVGKQRKALKFAFREKRTKRSTTHAEELRWLLDKVEFMDKFKGRSVRFTSGQNVSATVNAPLNQKFVCRDSINLTLQHPRYKDIVVQLVSVANQIELQPIAASSGLGNNVFVCERTRRRTLRESFRSKMTVFSGILLGIGSNLKLKRGHNKNPRAMIGTAIAAMAFLCPTIWSNFRATATKISRKNYESQLYEDLLFTYNKIARPVRNSSDVLLIDVGASLIRIIDVDEKNQVLTTNLWLEMRWNDAKLQWDPYKYGGIRQLHIPSTDIWVPDFVLYDNAAGDPDITIFTDALVSFNGRVYWQPPAIYKSFCPIKVKWFPYDKQECKMKFGAWSYTGFYVDLRQLPRDQIELRHSEKDEEYEYMENGMDLSFFHRSAEWDLMNLTAARHDVLYASCCGPEKFVDITYYLELRRKTLFFTCNLIVPCFLISFLTTFVFYLSDHKITFSISILVTLTVFFLVLIDLTPPTSLEVPMFGQYLITTMILVALSTMVSVVTVNIRFRSGATHQMSPWIRVIFLNLLPKMLLMKRPERPQKCKLSEPGTGQMPKSPSSMSANASPNALASICPSLIAKTPIERDGAQNAKGNGAPNLRTPRRSAPMSKGKVPPIVSPSADLPRVFFPAISANINRPKVLIPPPPYSNSSENAKKCRPSVSSGQNLSNLQISLSNNENRIEMIQGPMFGRSEGERDTRRRANDAIFANLVKQVRFIAEYFQRCEEEAEISDDWTFVAMVLDRLFLVIFSALNMATFSTIISAPSLFDFREPLNVTVPTRPLGQANLFSKHSQ